MNYRWEFLKRNPEFREDLEELKMQIQADEERLDRAAQRRAEESARLKDKLGRNLTFEEWSEIQDIIDEEVLGAQHTRCRERIEFLLHKMVEFWGIKWPMRIIKGEKIEPLSEDEVLGLAAVVIPNPGDNRYSPAEFKSILTCAHDKIFEPIEVEFPRLSEEKKREYKEKFGDKFDDIKPVLEPSESAIFWNRFDEYMATRIQFFKGYDPHAYLPSYQRKEPRDASHDIEVAERFLEGRQLETWIAIEVDVSRTKADILSDVKKILDVAHQIQEAEGVRTDTGRSHSEKFNMYLKIWDSRSTLHSYDQIARALYPDEYRDKDQRRKVVDRVTKQYAAAYRYICRRKYRRTDPHTLNEEVQQSLCQGCPVFGDCTETCPRVEHMLPKEDEGRSWREAPMNDIDTLADPRIDDNDACE